MEDTKVKAIIIALIISMVLIISIGVVLYVTTDLFKSSETLFMKYVSQNLGNIEKTLDISQEENISDLLQSNDYSDNFNLSLSYLEKPTDQEEVYSIKEEGIIENSKEKGYRNIRVLYNDEELSRIELLNENDILGFRLANLVQQFVSVKNENLPYFISNIGLDEKYFDDKLNKVTVSGLLNFSDEEVETLTNTYLKAIFTGVDSKSFSSKNNSVITLNNGQSITTNAYVLTINKNEFDKMCKRILTQVLSDSIILSKIDEIDIKLEEAGIMLPEGEKIKDKFITLVQNKANDLEYEGENTTKIKITVYEKDGITVRTELQVENGEYGYVLDTNENSLILKTSRLTETGEDIKTYALEKQVSEAAVKRTLIYSDTNNQNLEVNYTITKNGNTIESEGNLSYFSDAISNLSIDITSNTNISGGTTTPISFNENNNYILNDLEKDTIITLMDNLKTRLITSLEESRSKINTKLLNNILLWIDEREQEKERNEKEELELKKQTFNNQFNLYTGEELTIDHVNRLMQVVKDNLIDYKVVSGTEIVMEIKQDNKNEEKATEIMNLLDDKHKYNIKMDVSEDGYIKYIQLSVFVKDN